MTETPDTPGDHLALIAERAEAAATEAAALRLQITAIEEARKADRRRDRRVYLPSLALLVILILALGGGGWAYKIDQGHRSANAAADRKAQLTTARQTSRLVGRIDDCLNPQGKCGKQSAARTEELVKPTGPIGSLIVFGLACQRGNEGDDDAILACVQDKIEARGGG